LEEFVIIASDLQRAFSICVLSSAFDVPKSFLCLLILNFDSNLKQTQLEKFLIIASDLQRAFSICVLSFAFDVQMFPMATM
jgi:hypothetical protein